MLIGGFQPFTLSDFPGRPAAIVFTQGCNFKCPYCHNRPLWPRLPVSPPVIDEPGLYSFLESRSGQLDGLVITGGEPTVHEDLQDFIRKIKSRGFRVKLDTNGSNPLMLEALLAEELLDYIAMDIKGPEERYSQLCGITVDLDPIRTSQRLIATSGVDHLFRTTFYRKMLTEDDIDHIRQTLPPGSPYIVQEYREVSG